MLIQSLRIAIADERPDNREYLIQILRDDDYHCSTFSNGDDVIAAMRREQFDLLLLDWNMPRTSGAAIIAWLSQNIPDPPPAILLTSRNAKQDIIRALDAGVVDYIVKNEDPEVIRARIDAACRKRLDTAYDFPQFGDFLFDRPCQCVHYRGEAIDLRSKEFKLAQLLFDNLNRPLSRNYIMARIWNASPDLKTRTLDMHISRVRNKLCLRPERGVYLRSIFGIGYRLECFWDNVSLSEASVAPSGPTGCAD